jgi:type II secretory pathway pseudopilin PulG
MISRPRKPASRRTERGYILITIILFVALIAIAAVVMVPVIAFQVKRDREEELVHRGVQYSRAMKHFVKKFGRYPTRLEELENTNQMRFLRRRYKDPITGKDFKILRMGDVQMAFGGGIAGATPAGGLNPGGLNPGGLNPGGLNPGAAAIAGGGPKGALGTLAAAGVLAGGVNPGGPTPGAGTPTGSTAVAGQSPDDSAGGDTSGSTPNPGASFAAAGPGPPGSFGAVGQGSSAPGAQVFGGGPMVGVASTSKDKSIRIFNKKDHYYQWQFIYDPSSDRGGLLTTPNQPSLQGATNALQAGAPGTGGSAVAPGTFSGGVPGQTGPGVQSGQPTQPGMQPPQMPPDQE